jgi:hypothetical protein
MQLYESLLPSSLSVLVMGYVLAVLQYTPWIFSSSCSLSACILFQSACSLFLRISRYDHHGFLLASHWSAEDIDFNTISGGCLADVTHTSPHPCCCCLPSSLLAPCASPADDKCSQHDLSTPYRLWALNHSVKKRTDSVTITDTTSARNNPSRATRSRQQQPP